MHTDIGEQKKATVLRAFDRSAHVHCDDAIHCVHQQQGAEIREHLCALAPAPIAA